DPYQPISVINKTFQNQDVMLDGYSYTHCIFINVTFVYNGTTPFQMTDSKATGNIRVRSDNPAVTGAFALIKAINLGPNDKITIDEQRNYIVPATRGP